jgi:predicted dehydrogenase
MEKKVVKIGVVGMRRGRDVISNVVDDENIVLRAICDKDPDRLASAKKYFEEERHVKDLLCFAEKVRNKY